MKKVWREQLFFDVILYAHIPVVIFISDGDDCVFVESVILYHL